MSMETIEWLNRNVLIGFTDKRGTAWHYRSSAQGVEPNHYPGPIPVADVQRRLFSWRPIEADLHASYTDAHGRLRYVDDQTRKAIIHPDTGSVLGVLGKRAPVHEFNQWLIINLQNILDDTLGIGSAGLLRGGALAWVQAEIPDTIATPEGVAFRPFISAATALDGSMSSTYLTGAQLIVCDNTLSAALGSHTGAQVKIRHTAKSLKRLGEVRDTLGIIHQVADDFTTQVARLCDQIVTDSQWAAFVDAHTPLPEDEGRSRTLAQHKRGTLDQLWHADERVAPWRGTAFGVVQAVNTFVHHQQTVRGASRPERNMQRAVSGGVDDLDRQTLTTLASVLDRPALALVA